MSDFILSLKIETAHNRNLSAIAEQ